MSEKGKTLVERHALKRLAKVEKNKQKAYEKSQEKFLGKQLLWEYVLQLF